MQSKILEIKVIPNAKKNEIKGNKVYLTAPPIDNRANKALIEFIAGHFNIKKSQVSILKGNKSKNKVLSINL